MESTTPTVDGGQSGLTELTRSTQLVKPMELSQQLFSTPNPPKRTFAEVVAPSHSSKAPQTASHKFFLADSPPPSIGVVLTYEKGLSLVFTDAETEALAAPIRLALVGKFSHGKPQFRHLHCLTVGLGVKGAFTDALFTVANMIGTPLQIDDCTFNQSKLSKVRIGIEIDLAKPLVEGFALQINGATIHQKVEYEQLPKYYNLCKHVGHDNLECYTMGNAPRPPPRVKQSKGKKTMGTEQQVVTETAKAFERGQHGNDIAEMETSGVNCDSEVENDMHVDSAKDGNMPIVESYLPADNLVVGVVYLPIGGVETQTRKKRIKLQQASKLFKV
ncbi:UNVERIFIED_CONTAM: hypothetical protein Sindi_2342200 [Sesamum indicum]